MVFILTQYAVFMRCALLLKCHMFFWYTKKCDFMYALIFTKPTNTEQPFVQICCTEFYPNGTANM